MPSEKILVIKPSSLGDIVHALVVIESLRRQRGHAVHVTWLVRDIFSGILEACPTVDRVIRYDRTRGLCEIFRVGRALRQEHFDLVLDLQGLARSAFWALCARAPRKIGRGDGREGSRLVFRELAPPPPKGFKHAHAIEILLQFLKPLGLEAKVCGAVAFPRAKISPEIEKILDPNNNGFLAPILLFPESRRAEKEWFGFRDLTAQILDFLKKTNASDVPVVWIGGKPLATGSAFDEKAFPNFHSLMGKTSLADVLALVARARLCVTNDSGPMHIAAAAGVPVLGIFGPTSPELYGPFPPSAPTNRTICAPDNDLAKLSVEAVFSAVKKLLSETQNHA